MNQSISRGFAAIAVVTLAAGALGSTSATAQVAQPPEVGQSVQIPKGAPKPRRLADGHPNLTGFWTRPGGLLDVYHGPSGITPTPNQGPRGGAPGGNNGQVVPDHAPLKEPYKTRFAELQKNLAAGKVVDPVALCLPQGMPRMMAATYGLEILQTPGQITMTSEFQAGQRRIWMNKKHPPLEELDPTYTGHSIGHWQGDTLVVDTIGVRGDVPLNQAGLPHSDKMHLVERFTVHGGELKEDITLDDPDAYETPWHITYTYRFRPDLHLEEYVCEENNAHVGANGQAVFDK